MGNPAGPQGLTPLTPDDIAEKSIGRALGSDPQGLTPIAYCALHFRVLYLSSDGHHSVSAVAG